MNALDDGVITEDELEKITELQNQLNLEDHHLKAILELVGQRNPQQSDKS